MTQSGSRISASIPLPDWTVEKFMTEQLYACVPKEHELAGDPEICWSDLNGFNFLLRSELGFWDTLCREKMPTSKFLVQTEEAAFEELVRASTLPCFTTDYIVNRDSVYPGRVNIPIMDEEAKITFYVIKQKG